jgi:GTP:adenosylcobinamide-phosphate guanylyltransferase
MHDLKHAIDLLGTQHPLVRVMDDIRARVRQATVVTAIIAASATAALAGVADARAALVAAVAVEVALVCVLAALAAAKRDHLLDLIIEGREHLPLPQVARERERLLDSRYRTQLSQSLEALHHEAEHPILHRPSDLPLYRRGVIAAVAPDLVETARSLRNEHAGSAGVALAERLLNGHDSPLYDENAERLRVQLRRCRFLLAGTDCRTVD